ncbi:MAG: hypothetical protein L3J12_06740, partial [Spirochaetales bacterium]|nr:hypothetical protein [Spirochaetales bacterium]
MNLLDTIQKKQVELYTSQVNHSIEEKSNTTNRSIDKNIRAVSEEALGLAAFASSNNEVIAAYNLALSGNIDDPYSPES